MQDFIISASSLDVPRFSFFRPPFFLHSLPVASLSKDSPCNTVLLSNGWNPPFLLEGQPC